VKAKKAKRLALEGFKSALQRMMEMQERYAKFRVRRLTHAWATYGEGIKAMCESERDVLGEISRVVREWRAEGGEEEVVNRVELDVEFQIQEAPTVVGVAERLAFPE
jgi:hypothetical protein